MLKLVCLQIHSVSEWPTRIGKQALDHISLFSLAVCGHQLVIKCLQAGLIQVWQLKEDLQFPDMQRITKEMRDTLHLTRILELTVHLCMA